MTIYVERYRICGRCNTRNPVKDSIQERLTLTYHGVVDKIGYCRKYDVHLCGTCAVEFIEWMERSV